MKKTSKIIEIILLSLAAFGILNMMTSHGLNTLGRYQYLEFNAGNGIRFLVDILLLTSLIILIIRKWNEKPLHTIHIIISALYIGFILMDIRIWLWLKDSNPIYYSSLTWYGLSIIVILKDLFLLTKLTSNQLLLIGFVIIITGFTFEILFINLPYQDAPYHLYSRLLFFTQITRLIYFIGISVILVSIIDFVKNKIIISRSR